MTTEVEVEYIPPGRGKVVDEAASREMPCITVLSEAVREQKGTMTSMSVGQVFSHHRESHVGIDVHDLFHERDRWRVGPLDGLTDDVTVGDGDAQGLSVRHGEW